MQITKVSNLFKSYFSIYPNPASRSQKLTVIYDLNTNNSKGIIRIHDVSGKEVYVANVNNNGLMSHSISIDNLQKGLYIISMNVNGEQKTDRIMIN